MTKEQIKEKAKDFVSKIAGGTSIETIKSGVADKLEKDNIKVYRVVNIIRIDVKE